MTTPFEEVREHYEAHWGPVFDEVQWSRGPMLSLDPEFEVLVFPPRERRACWTYATCGMCNGPGRPLIETHVLIASRNDDACAELLTMLAHFHNTGEPLDLHHTVAFGQPWARGSGLDCGILSLPYLDGPTLEWQHIGAQRVRHLWLLPITRAERELKTTRGVDALEQLFEDESVRYDDPMRASLV